MRGEPVSGLVMGNVGEIVSSTTINSGSVMGLVISALVMAAVLMIIVPSSWPVLTVTGKVRVMRVPAVMVRPLARIGGESVMPLVPSRLTGPIKVSPSGRVSEMRALVMSTRPPLLTEMV